MNAAKEALVAISGEKKAEIVRATLEEAVPFGANPCQLLKPARVTWLLDQGAASKLNLHK